MLDWRNLRIKTCSIFSKSKNKIILINEFGILSLATRLLKERGIDIVGAINRPGPKIGKDLGLLAGINYLNVPISDEPEKVLSKTADIVMILFGFRKNDK